MLVYIIGEAALCNAMLWPALALDTGMFLCLEFSSATSALLPLYLKIKGV
jgi:hypothetical protein